MAYACQLDKKGFVWWYRLNHITGNLDERLEKYYEHLGIRW